MTIKNVEVKQYDFGDVIDISDVKGSPYNGHINYGKRALILERKELKCGLFSYDVLVDAKWKAKITIRPDSGEKYVGKMDLSMMRIND